MQRMTVIIILALFSLLAYAEPVNINTATAKQMAKEIKGVGSKKANAIVEYREKNGPFQTVDEITKVSGIGIETLRRNHGNLIVETPVSDARFDAQKKPTANQDVSEGKTF